MEQRTGVGHPRLHHGIHIHTPHTVPHHRTAHRTLLHRPPQPDGRLHPLLGLRRTTQHLIPASRHVSRCSGGQWHGGAVTLCGCEGGRAVPGGCGCDPGQPHVGVQSVLRAERERGGTACSAHQRHDRAVARLQQHCTVQRGRGVRGLLPDRGAGPHRSAGHRAAQAFLRVRHGSGLAHSLGTTICCASGGVSQLDECHELS